MPAVTKIQVNPLLLVWAREEAGYDIEGISTKLGINTSRYQNWETTGKDIPLGILKNIANHYKRQLAVFMLPKAPPKIKKPKDHRNLSKSQAGLSPETLLSIRRSHRYLELGRDILGNQWWNKQYQWIKETEPIIRQHKTVVNEEIIGWLRAKLKIDIEKQSKCRDYKIAFRKWRNAIEKELSIFVFHFPMPENELDGFCYAEDNPPYAIVVNSNTREPRKIFTLFHELAHIFKHQSGICLPDIASENQDLEFECNAFAGKFLIPDRHVYPTDNFDGLSNLARKFCVSREVYLRRNLERDFISRNQFFTLLKELREHTPPPPKIPNKPPIIKPTVRSKSARGEMFYNLIMDAVTDNLIDYNTASDALSLGINHIINE